MYGLVAPGNFVWQRVGAISSATTTSTSAVDLGVFSGLNVPVTAPLMIVGNFGKDATSANGVALGLSINATVVYEAQATALIGGSGTQRAEDGAFYLFITPRTAATLTGVLGQYTSRVSSTGAQATAPTAIPPNAALTALIPNAVITSVTLRGINLVGSNNLFISGVTLYVGGA